MVSTSIDMMSTAINDPALANRLERLTGEDAACCVPEYRDLAKEVAASSRFPQALKRARALADENRLLAVALLQRRKELCACEIQAATGLTHATISHHMGVLVDAGFVRSRRQGKWIYYRLNGPAEVGVP
jgi:DNA-binding transcriptional ArsR family regulator